MRTAILLLLIATSAIADDEPTPEPASVETNAESPDTAPDPDRVERLLRSAETRTDGCCDGSARGAIRTRNLVRSLERRLSRTATRRGDE